MKKILILTLVLAVCFIWPVFPLLAKNKVQDEGQIEEQIEWQEFNVGPPVKVNLNDLPQAATLTDEQIAWQEFSLDLTHRRPEAFEPDQRITVGPELYPTKGETVEADEFAPQNPGSWQQVITHGLTSSELLTVSNVAEPSVGFSQMKKGFMAYNWGAARSDDHGVTWTPVNPYTTGGIPTGYTFCCDQYVVFDPLYNMHYWLRLVLHPSGGGALVLGVSPNTTSWWFYVLAQSTTNLPDFPKLELTRNFLYITYNEFVGSFTQTFVLRLPLLPMTKAQNFGGWLFTVSDWFTIKVAQNHGFNSRMYAASNWPLTAPANRVRVWTWDESSTGIANHTITVNDWGYGSSINCPCPTGGDPCARSDSRILGAVVSSNSKFPESGKNQLWLAWGSDNHGSFVYPYIYMVQINVNDWTVLDYDPIYNSSHAFQYPALAVNGAGDIGIVFDAIGGSRNTSFGAMLLDGDLQDYDAGYSFVTIATGDRCPTDNKWGDYNDIEPWWRNRYQFVASGHIRSLANGSQPFYVRFTNSDNFP